MEISKALWHKRYRQALQEIGGMNNQQAFKYLIDGKGEFDYGYSPEWYVKEEMACTHNFAIFKVCYIFEGKVVE